MENKYKKLANNSILFLVANFGSKIISFVMVPFYTYALSTGEYGTVDIVTSTVSMLAPLVTMGIGDVVTLKLVKGDMDIGTVFKSSSLILLIGNILILIILLFFRRIDFVRDYLIYFYVLIFLQSAYGILQSYIRGIGRVVSFAISGVLYTLVLVVCNVIFLTKLSLGVNGYLLSMIIAYLIGSVFLLFNCKLKIAVKSGKISKNALHSLLKLGIPLLPNAMLWWLMNISDKYTITYFMGTPANGLYTVGHKLPTIISTVYSIFQQAWQLTSMEMSSKEERSRMYSQMFELLTCAFFITTSFIVLVSKPVISLLCEKTYETAWTVVPLLTISAMYNSISGFIGSNYILMENTLAALKVTAIGTFINILLNVALVPCAGIEGAALATCLGFIFMVWKKMRDTREFTPLNYDRKRFMLANIILLFQIITYRFQIKYISYILSFIMVMLMIILYRRLIVQLLTKGKKFIIAKIRKK